MINNEPTTLTFEPNENKYSYDTVEYQLPRNVCFGTAKGAKGPPSNPYKMIANPITFKGNSITFHPNGIIKSGTIYLCDSKRNYNYALSCSVAQVSYIRKYQYSDGWQLL